MRISDWSSDVCSSDLRLRQLAAQALERAPELPEWIEPSVLARKGWPAWREALHAVHGDPAHAKARERLAYDEIFAGQLALMLVRASARRRRGISIQGAGHLPIGGATCRERGCPFGLVLVGAGA